MKIIQFQSAQWKTNIPTAIQPGPSLVAQYRGYAKDETLTWVTFAICGVVSIVLCLCQLQNDVRRIHREHTGSPGTSRLAEKAVHVIEVSRAL
jgi:hypothetical protein